MSIREQIEELADSTFEEIGQIENAYKQAEQRRSETQQHKGVVSPEYAAKAARAEADYLAAREAYRGMQRNLPGKAQEKMAAIRREYAQEVARQFAVDPEKLDTAELELLKSGIMRPDEYRAMLEKEARAGKFGEGSAQARELRAVGYVGNIDPGAAALQTFDNVAEILRRCVNNPGMIPHWDGLAGPLLDLL